MPTIKDIAALAGVSPATVSRVLSGHITVKDETRRRIEEAVQRLDYRPNFLARSLVLKETKTIGVVIPDILNPYYSGLVRGVEDEAQRVGRSVVLCNTDNKVGKETSYLELLEYRHVDGIILVSAGHSGEHLQGLLDRKIPLVLASRRLDGVEVDTVAVDNTGGAYEATRHLIQLGHRRIAMIAGNLFLRTGQERLEGYRRAHSEAGIPIDEKLVVTKGSFQFQEGYAVMRNLLRRSYPPTAVFAANDILAMGAISAVQSQGLSVPKDVAVVGFDGIRFGELLNPRLTTVSVRTYEMGRMACRLLIDRLTRKKDRPPRLVVSETHLEIRESCGARLAPGSG
ncbi:MAG: LacI family DNA-binding transcriptional regulator [Sphingomonadaceae bacterium]